MINLLPGSLKAELAAARTNAQLLKYLLLFAAAAGFIALIIVGSTIILTQTRVSTDALIESNSADASVFGETQKKIAALSDDLTSARTILDSRFSVSALLTTVGGLMPEGTVADSIPITPAVISGGPLTIRIYAKTPDAAAAARDRFQQSPSFASANLESVSETNGISGYPVSATLRLTIARGAF